MKTIYILMGIIGAGKSTHARRLQEKFGGTIFASDEIRKEFVTKGEIPAVYDSKYNYIVFDEMHRRIESSAMMGENIIVDSTNVPASSREPIIQIAKKYGYKVCGELLLLDDAECAKRIIHRQQTDPNSHIIANIDEAIKIYKERLEKGQPQLKEGFHQINTYNNGILVDTKSSILISSTNIGKIAIYSTILDKLGLSHCSLRDLDINIQVEETGKTEEENAILKAKAYYQEGQLPVIANDSGLIIEKFAPEDQPGVFVRRYGGKELSDEETIAIFSEKLKAVGGESDSYFNVALAIVDGNGKLHTQNFKSYRYMIATPSKTIQKGLPLRSLDYNKQMKKYMSEMTIEEANACEGKCIEEQAIFIEQCLASKVQNSNDFLSETQK